MNLAEAGSGDTLSQWAQRAEDRPCAGERRCGGQLDLLRVPVGGFLFPIHGHPAYPRRVVRIVPHAPGLLSGAAVLPGGFVSQCDTGVGLGTPTPASHSASSRIARPGETFQPSGDVREEPGVVPHRSSSALNTACSTVFQASPSGRGERVTRNTAFSS